MQTNGDLRPVTRSQTNSYRGKLQNTVVRANPNGKKVAKATRIKIPVASSFRHGNSNHAQSTTLSSASNLSAGENTAPPLHFEGPEYSDDPLDTLRSQRRELAVQTNNALHDECRIHVKPDAYSCMEIKTMLESLNCDIMQLAALMTDKLYFKHVYAKSLGDLAKLNDAAENVQAILGRRVTELLMQKIPRDMQSIVVQAAIQSALAKACQRVIRRWSISWEEHDLFVTSYNRVIKLSSSETIAQWRAATRGIVKYGAQSDGTRNFALGVLIDDLLDVLHIAGWRSSAPKENIQGMFGDRIRELVELTIRVDRAIHEGALSQDLRLFMPGYDEAYDTSMMEDNNQGPNAEVSEGKVAICVNIGLKLGEKRKSDESGTKEVESSSASGQKVVLKAKVVLDAALGI